MAPYKQGRDDIRGKRVYCVMLKYGYFPGRARLNGIGEIRLFRVRNQRMKYETFFDMIPGEIR